MTLRATILGCGSSGGVPRLGPIWGSCDPNNPKNNRLRCSLLIEKILEAGRTTILIDTSPDMRQQLLAVGCTHLDGVLFTHDHADHTHGIDDLRMVSYAMKKKVSCFFNIDTRNSLRTRFSYCFVDKDLSGYRPILNENIISEADTLRIAGRKCFLDVQAIPQLHGDITSLGFRVGGLAYSPDISGVPDVSLPLLENLDVWIVDALRYTDHPSHFSVKQALKWIEKVQPKRAILTHMTSDLDYDVLKKELPEGVEPAYDGMVIDIMDG